MVNVYNLIKIFFEKYTISVKENFTNAEIIVENDCLLIPSAEDINRLSLFFPARDEIIIDLKLDDDDPISLNVKQTTNTSDFVDKITYINRIKDEQGKFTLKLNIIKKIDNSNKITIYDFDSFVEYFNHQNCIDILHILKPLINEKKFVLFESQSTIDEFFSSTLYFSNSASNIVFKPFERKDILNLFIQTSHFSNFVEYNFCPHDFHLIKKSSNEIVNKIFNQLSILFSIIYLSNISTVNNNKLNFKIDGYKSISNEIDLYNIPEKMIYLNQYYKIVEWIYNGGNIIDKIGLARNIYTLHIINNDYLSADDNIFSAIISSHEIYLKENVQQYIELKNKLSDFLIETSNKTQTLFDIFSNSFKNNLLGFLSFFVTVIVMNSFSEHRLENIFTRDITNISYCLLAISLFFLMVSLIEVYLNITRMSDNYFKFKNRYNGFLDEKDLNNIFGTNDIDDIKFIKKIIITYSVLWLLIIFIIFSTIHHLNINATITNEEVSKLKKSNITSNTSEITLKSINGTTTVNINKKQ